MAEANINMLHQQLWLASETPHKIKEHQAQIDSKGAPCIVSEGRDPKSLSAKCAPHHCPDNGDLKQYIFLSSVMTPILRRIHHNIKTSMLGFVCVGVSEYFSSMPSKLSDSFSNHGERIELQSTTNIYRHNPL
jgi:hypothetical protein